MTNFEHGRLDGASGKTRWVKGYAAAQDEYDAGYNPANAKRLQRILASGQGLGVIGAQAALDLIEARIKTAPSYGMAADIQQIINSSRSPK